jgi:hypothetical protein
LKGGNAHSYFEVGSSGGRAIPAKVARFQLVDIVRVGHMLRTDKHEIRRNDMPN